MVKYTSKRVHIYQAIDSLNQKIYKLQRLKAELEGIIFDDKGDLIKLDTYPLTKRQWEVFFEVWNIK